MLGRRLGKLERQLAQDMAALRHQLAAATTTAPATPASIAPTPVSSPGAIRAAPSSPRAVTAAAGGARALGRGASRGRMGGAKRVATAGASAANGEVGGLALRSQLVSAAAASASTPGITGEASGGDGRKRRDMRTVTAAGGSRVLPQVACLLPLRVAFCLVICCLVYYCTAACCLLTPPRTPPLSPCSLLPVGGLPALPRYRQRQQEEQRRAEGNDGRLASSHPPGVFPPASDSWVRTDGWWGTAAGF